jgi:hypothetical protein
MAAHGEKPMAIDTEGRRFKSCYGYEEALAER